VSVAANILQGTVSTLLSLLNAKGQIVGAVVQSAPPVLASVTRTAGDVLAAKARIFGAVTQSAVNFASQLAQTVTNTFSALFNGANGLGLNTFGRGGDNALGGYGNLAQTIINSQLNLLNGILAPFTQGSGGSSGSVSSGRRFSLANLFRFGRNRGGEDSSAQESNDDKSEPNFRITIGPSTPETPAESQEHTDSDDPDLKPEEPEVVPALAKLETHTKISSA